MNNSSGLIKEQINFILSHFHHQHELFPRTIMKSESAQIRIPFNSNLNQTIEEIYHHFEGANFKDCRINAFPSNTSYQMLLGIMNKTAADFIFIDLDFEGSKNVLELNKKLDKVLRKLNVVFKGAHPTILFTGKGYHIYQPINGIILEKEDIFHKYLPYLNGHDLTTEFLRFAKDFFASNIADSQNNPSIKSCMTRVPSTINSRNGETVIVIQKWDGNRPNLRFVTSDFLMYLIQKRRTLIKQRNHNSRRRQNKFAPNCSYTHNISWIDNLLKGSLEDYRKYCLWRILGPYLVNVRKLSNEEASRILMEWLERCEQIGKLDFSPTLVIKNNLRSVKTYLPPSVEKLKKDHTELYELLKLKSIVF